MNVPGEFNSVWPLPQIAESKLGTFAAADWYDADDYFWNSIGTIYDPVLHEPVNFGAYISIPLTAQHSTIDLGIISN